MAKYENPPFERGTYQTDGFANQVGKLYQHEDVDYNQTGGTKPKRSGKYVTVMLVKNNSGFALLPKRLVALSTTAGQVGQVAGYTRTTAAQGYPVDEFLPSAGVPDGAYFYIVVQGPAMCIVSLSDLAAVVNVGDYVVAITAATSGATTAGRIAAQDLTGATAVLAAQILNRVGRALTARTTANTNSDILLDIQQVF